MPMRNDDGTENLLVWIGNVVGRAGTCWEGNVAVAMLRRVFFLAPASWSSVKLRVSCPRYQVHRSKCCCDCQTNTPSSRLL